METSIAETDRQLEHDLGVFFATSRLGLVQADLASGRILRANHALIELLDESEQRLTQRCISELAAPEDRERVEGMLSAMIGNPQASSQMEVRLLRRDSTPIEVLLSATSLEGDRSERAWIVVQDVAEFERADDEHSARRKDQFLATLSHELRNPLAPIRNATRIARTPTSTPEQLQWSLGVIDRQVQHMARLLDDLLDMSRITRGMLELRTERTNLLTSVNDAIDSVKPLAEARRHRVHVVHPPEPIFVDGDPVRLTQIFSNLLTNAAKYMDAGGDITVETRESGDCARVSVRDTGSGIQPELRSKLFQVHTPSSRTRGRAEGGLGLGLALVHGLVTLHRGKVEVHSEGPGRGSEFVVCLPIARTAGRTQHKDRMRAFAEASNAQRVLIADDNVDSAESLALLLRLQGHEVHIATDGEQAIQLAERVHPDVALLDIGMPVKDGNAVAQWIREQEWGAKVALIAVSGWTQPFDRERTRATGFDRHLAKPVGLQKLTEAIAEARRERQTA